MVLTPPTPSPAANSGPAREIAGQAFGWAHSLWNFPLLDIQDAQVTVGSLIIATAVVVLGALASRLGSRVLVGFLSRRFGIHTGAASAAQSLLFYALITVVVLLALRVADVPMSIFAVAGGALAIGVGFGSQNVINNFISGVILLVEQPVRVGDIVQLDGPTTLNGVVRQIGARSTRIVTGENLEIVVPNSALLQHSVVNWTLTDDEVRAHITVGVAYNTTLHLARQLLLESAAEHGLVLKSPAPVVLCDDFGDNAIVLRLYFWMRVRRAFERRTVESDLRFKVDTLFRRHGVVIAFPQRDVHLVAPPRVDVRLSPGGFTDAADSGEPAPRKGAARNE